ncbi:MAG: dihydroxy-acid dehydratase, partial [Clostridia bacterium]|nr:dihydroxy-acid dehydratase [Clostridia bacterium]
GILPFPKYEESQKAYHTFSRSTHAVIGMPVTCPDYDRAGAVLEAIACVNHETVVPVYFETALKVKYSRDDDSAEMYDLILAGSTLNFGYLNKNCMYGTVTPPVELFIDGAINPGSYLQRSRRPRCRPEAAGRIHHRRSGICKINPRSIPMQNNYSPEWKKRGDRTGLIRNALLKSMGYTDRDIEKPIIGIINTWAETNPGHYHFRQLSEAVKRGVWAAGGFPLEVNTMSICEVFFDLSSLIYRNLLSETTEELIARHPFDGVVLIGGCDKNVPAQLMAAVSANKPTIFLPGGAMLPGYYKGQMLVCGTASFHIYNRYTSGEITLDEMTKYEGCLYGSAGACPIMGTANTCQTVAEALGIALPNSASSLGLSAEKARTAEDTGRAIVELVEKDIKCCDIITEKSIENAITVLMACGGSTNLIIHLIAIARRAGIHLTLEDFARISDKTPVVVNVKPHGTEAVGSGFHNAGGVFSLMKELEGRLHLDCLTVSGKTVGENLADADMPYDTSVIRPLDDPIETKGGIAVLYGNLAPGGAVIKRSAASPELMRHRGPAKVFEDLDACKAWLLDDA